jgi:hypothetical protein
MIMERRSPYFNQLKESSGNLIQVFHSPHSAQALRRGPALIPLPAD